MAVVMSLDTLSKDGGKLYHELSSHPVPCSKVNSRCSSTLKMVLAAAIPFPLLRRFLYDVLRHHQLLEQTDTLCRRFGKDLLNESHFRFQYPIQSRCA